MIKKILRRFTLPTPKIANFVFTICSILLASLMAGKYFEFTPEFLDGHIGSVGFFTILIGATSKYLVKREHLTSEDLKHFWEKEKKEEL